VGWRPPPPPAENSLSLRPSPQTLNYAEANTTPAIILYTSLKAGGDGNVCETRWREPLGGKRLWDTDEVSQTQRLPATEKWLLLVVCNQIWFNPKKTTQTTLRNILSNLGYTNLICTKSWIIRIFCPVPGEIPSYTLKVWVVRKSELYECFRRSLAIRTTQVWLYFHPTRPNLATLNGTSPNLAYTKLTKLNLTYPKSIFPTLNQENVFGIGVQSSHKIWITDEYKAK